MRERCIELVRRTGKLATLRAIYGIKGDTAEEFVANSSDRQVEGIIKACERELGIN